MKTYLKNSEFAKITFLFLFLSFTCYSFAQTNSTLSAPSLKISNYDNTFNLKIQSVYINVKIIKNLAVTNIEIDFLNSTNRTLEGELLFPLAENQSITRFAMEINEKLREAVPVEKAKGRQTFEEIVRRGVDPALLEQTEGNVFRARVYPIFPNKVKKIILGYEEQLQSSDGNMIYRLPLNYKELLDNFGLTLQVINPNKEPLVSKKWIEDIKFEKENNYYVIKSEYKNFNANEQIEISIPEDENPSITFENYKGKTYFLYSFPNSFKTIDKENPKRILILNDISKSMASRDIDREIELLKAYFLKIKNFEVRLINFSIFPDEPKDFTIVDGNINKLLSHIYEVEYDGASQFGTIPLNYQCDEILLLSDGLSNFGDKEFKTSNIPVYTINSSQMADHTNLQYISNKTGGNYINLLNLNNEEAFNLLKQFPICYLNASYNSNDVDDIITEGRTIKKGNYFITGIAKSRNFSFNLKFKDGLTTKSTQNFNFELPEKIIQGETLAKLWAKYKINDLNLQFEKNSEEIGKLGKEFNIVTKNTSLIILETVQDYVRYDIEPPDDLKEEYLKMKEKIISNVKERKNSDSSVINKILNSYFTWNEKYFKTYEELSIEYNKKRIENLQKNEQFLDKVINDDLKFIESQTNKLNGKGTLKCFITDDLGRILPSAEVRINSTRLDPTSISSFIGVALSNGICTFENLNPGYYQVIVRYSNMDQYYAIEEISPDKVTLLNISLVEDESRINKGIKVYPIFSSADGKGTLVCSVKDSNGNALQGATLKLVNTRLGAVTKRDGTGRIFNISPGSYDLKVTYVGFKPLTYKVEVKSDSIEFLNIKLFMVNNPSKSAFISSIAREGLQSMVGLSTGVFNSGEGFNIRGSRSSLTTIRVDGLDIGNQFSSMRIGSSRFSPLVSAYATEEVNLLTNTYSAEFSDDFGSKFNNFVVPIGDNYFNQLFYKNFHLIDNKRFNKINNSYFDFTLFLGELFYNERSIKFKGFNNPKDNYYYQLENVGNYGFFQLYNAWKRENPNNPHFFIDASEIAAKKDIKNASLIILSNLAEMDYENPVNLRILAARFKHLKNYKDAIKIYRDILKIREEEPQSYRDLALVLAENEEYQEAADLLYKALTNIWDRRFNGIVTILFNEFNKVLNDSKGKVNIEKYDQKFIKFTPADIRIVINWDSDNTDIDLMVTEPGGEECNYNNRMTTIGGHLSNDLTGGYGPEEYLLKRASKGEYIIKAKYYNNRSQKAENLPVTIFIEIYKNYGKQDEKLETKMITLKKKSETIEIGKLIIEN